MTPQETGTMLASFEWTKAQLAGRISDAIRAAVAEEREACAQIADEMDSGTEADIGVGTLRNPHDVLARDIAAAIRARGETERAG